MGTKQAVAFAQTLEVKRTTIPPAWIIGGCLFGGDLIALSITYWAAVIGRHLVNPGYELNFYLNLFPAIGFFLMAFVIQGLYPGILIHPVEEIRRVVYCITTVFLIICTATFLWRTAEAYSRSVFLFSWLSGAPIVLIARYVIRETLGDKPWWGVPTVVLGSGTAAQRIVSTIKSRHVGLKVNGILTEEFTVPCSSDFPPVVAGPIGIQRLASTRGSTYAIIAMPNKSNAQIRQIIEDYCQGFRHVLLMPDLPALCSLGVQARELGGELGFEVPQRLLQWFPRALKRCLDLFVASTVLLVLLPILLGIAVAIKSTSEGPVLFRQRRCGRGGEMFQAFKFRTMVPNADNILETYLETNPVELKEWTHNRKLKRDPRVTTTGRWLRRYSLDELPQLLNVLAGQMSVVGPRPIIEAEIPKYGDGYKIYKQVFPGITGLWQVSGRSNTTYQERVSLDKYYVRNWSIWLDIYILARTVSAVLSADGAY